MTRVVIPDICEAHWHTHTTSIGYNSLVLGETVYGNVQYMAARLTYALLFLVLERTYSSFSDMPVWSKLESGRLPHQEELIHIINEQLKFRA